MTSAALLLIIYGTPAHRHTGALVHTSTPATPAHRCTGAPYAPTRRSTYMIYGQNAAMSTSLNSFHELLLGIFMQNISPVYFLNKSITNRCAVRKLSAEYFMRTTACRRVGHADVEPCRCLKFYI